MSQSVRVTLGATLVALSLSATLLFFQESDELVVGFLDVGQGDATFIETPEGVQILIDAGPDRKVLRELGKLMPFHDRSIDIVIATHPDKDHIGGIPEILKRYDVSLLIEPGIHSDIGEYQFIQQFGGVQHLRLDRAMSMVADRVEINFLFPDRNVSGLEKNAGSIIAQLRYGEHEFLFMGDAPKSIEKYLVSKHGEKLKSDVLKVGHHGSKTSTDESFVEIVDPDFSVISAGADNRYGHPHDDVIETLSDSHTLLTSDGTIIFTSDGKNLKFR